MPGVRLPDLMSGDGTNEIGPSRRVVCADAVGLACPRELKPAAQVQKSAVPLSMDVRGLFVSCTGLS